VVNSVTVRFVCGYASTNPVPEGIKAAMKIMVKHWYRTGRDLVTVGNIVTDIPHTVNALLWPFKAF
jgi:hypothetical protein